MQHLDHSTLHLGKDKLLLHCGNREAFWHRDSEGNADEISVALAV